MGQRRSQNASGGLPGSDGRERNDIVARGAKAALPPEPIAGGSEPSEGSDLKEIRAMAARSRSGESSGGVPVPNAAELSGVRVHRSSVVGVRFTPPAGIGAGSAELPNWLWTVLGCLSE